MRNMEDEMETGCFYGIVNGNGMLGAPTPKVRGFRVLGFRGCDSDKVFSVSVWGSPKSSCSATSLTPMTTSGIALRQKFLLEHLLGGSLDLVCLLSNLAYRAYSRGYEG